MKIECTVEELKELTRRKIRIGIGDLDLDLNENQIRQINNYLSGKY